MNQDSAIGWGNKWEIRMSQKEWHGFQLGDKEVADAIKRNDLEEGRDDKDLLIIFVEAHIQRLNPLEWTSQ